MRFLILTLAIATALVLLERPSANHLMAYKYSSDLGGGGYQEVRTCVVLAPAALFALVLIGAIIAIATKAEHGHAHSH